MGFFDNLFGKKSQSNAPPALNIDDDMFLIINGVLREYRGNNDTIVVPQGVSRISNVDHPIWNNFIDTIFIPRSVLSIGECALPYCECVRYEGSEQQWDYVMKNCDVDNFQTGWKPAWCPEGCNTLVTEVRFHFNCHSAWAKK